MVTHTLDQMWTDAETEKTMAWAVLDRKGTIMQISPYEYNQKRGEEGW